MPLPYQGIVRIIDGNGFLLTVGTADLNAQEDGRWGGTLRVIAGTAVAGKALVVTLDGAAGGGPAQLIPDGVEGDNAISTVVGLGAFV